MGCGAICGDEGVQSATSISIAITTMQKLLPQLAKTSCLLSGQTVTLFMEMYNQNAKSFHLLPQSPLRKTETVPTDVLTRWKVVLYGLDNDKQHYSQCLGLPTHDSKGQESGILGPESKLGSTIVHHDCFVQIEKDLDRTLLLTESRRRDFEVVLKRIANFFPKMGYTQGINFVVAYLLTMGYSQDDSFWIFVHLSLNRRYMLLGLYEDGFPLCNLLCVLFKNMLRRVAQPLYQHLFEVLMVDISMWCFKWFMTCFIYSFPLQVVHYAWDLMMQLGAFGMVTMAVALTQQLQPALLDKQDMCELSQFLKEMAELPVFNHFVNMEKVVKNSYLIEIMVEDFEGAEQSAGFYAVYFKQNCKAFQQHLKKNNGLPKFQQQRAQSQAELLLNNWYDSLLEQRKRFLQKDKPTQLFTSFGLPLQSNTKQRDYNQFQADLVFCNKEQESTAPQGRLRHDNTSSSVRSDRQPHKYRVSYPIDRINEHLEQQSKSAKSQSYHRSVATPIASRRSSSMMSLNQLEQLDKLQQEVYNNRKNVKINNYAVPPKEPRDIKMPKKGPQSMHQMIHLQSTYGNKAAHKMGMRASNTFTMTGQNILNIKAYDTVSVSSKNASQREKQRVRTNKNLAVDSRRGCACKIKTEQNKLSSNFDKSSQRPSSKGQFSDDKDSICNSVCKQYLSREQQNISDAHSISMQNVDTYRERMEKTASYMVNSHGPTLREGSPHKRIQELESMKEREKAESEVEVLPFKKDKKLKQGRISHIEIAQRNELRPPRESNQPEEESLQVVEPFSFERTNTFDGSGGPKSGEACIGSSR